jgi:nitrogen fixation protein FixH
MSWSYRITVLYLGFVGIIVTLVTIASRQKIELESKDYYQQELRYENKLQAIENTNQLNWKIEHAVNAESITLTIPASEVKSLSGEVYFFCPADSDNDLKLKMNFCKDGKQIIPRSQLKKGAYKLKLSWSASGKDYFREEVITLQ